MKKVINKLLYYESEGFNPYFNLAVEECLLNNLNEGECILYLWQNQNTVVIGRNQNCWKECRVSLLEEEGGRLARRLSGGGAVYHDLGNLNFTFITGRKDYDVARQLSVVIRALEDFRISPELSGRNDVTVGGRKCSGNAFYRQGDSCYHHGTLLLEVDMARMMRYLAVDPGKLAAKGVDSVRSRTVNLCSLAPDLTVASLKGRLREAFGSLYGLPVGRLPAPGAGGAGLEEKYASPRWKYGRTADFSHRFSRRFPWGDAEISLKVEEGRVTDALIRSDAMDFRWVPWAEQRLLGRYFSSAALARDLIKREAEKEGIDGLLITDIRSLILEQGF